MPAKTYGSVLVVAALFLCGCGCEQVNEGVSQSPFCRRFADNFGIGTSRSKHYRDQGQGT